MPVQHRDIPESGLHEPKGVSTALAGTSYVADGLGSGSWQGAALTSVKVIKSEDDMPSNLQMEDNTNYVFDGTVSLTKDYVVGASSQISGTYASNCIINYTGTGTPFTFTDTNFGVRSLTITSTSTEPMIKGSGQVAQLHRINVTNMIAVAPKIFDLTNVIPVLSICNFTGFTTGIKMVGSGVATYSSFKVLWTGAEVGSVAVDLGTATFFGINIEDSIHTGPGIGIKAAANSANLEVGAIGSIRGGDFRATTPLDGITSTDASWELDTSNTGIEPSKRTASGHVVGNAQPTTFPGTGLANAVKVDLDSSVVPGDQNTFTTDSTGRFTYLGTKDKSFYVSYSVFGEIGGGAAREYVYMIAVDGVPVEASSSKNQYDGSSPGSTNCSAEVTLSTNSYVELWVYAATATTDLVADTVSGKVV